MKIRRSTARAAILEYISDGCWHTSEEVRHVTRVPAWLYYQVMTSIAHERRLEGKRPMGTWIAFRLREDTNLAEPIDINRGRCYD